MSAKNKLIVIFGAALAARLILILFFKTYEHPIFSEYEAIINNILSGKGFVYDFLRVHYKSFCNPLYSYFCAGIYLLTDHSYFAVLAVQSAFTILLALTVFNIAKTVFNEDIGVISAAITCFHPGFLYYDVFNLVPLSIDTFIIAAVAYLFLKFKGKPAALNMFLVGGMIGLGVLSRGIIGALLPFLSLYILIYLKQISLKDRAKAIVFLSLATFIVITPWIVRNYVIHKEIMIISTTGETFWRGNNRYAVGTSLAKDGNSVFAAWPEEFRNKVYALDELGQKKFFEKEAFDYIRDNPLKFIERYLTKVYYFWWFSPQSGMIYPKIYLSIYKYLYSCAFLVSILGVAIAIFFRGNVIRGNALVLITVFMAVCLTQSFFYVEGRHKWLIEPLLFIFFSYGVSECYGFLKNKGRRIFA